MPHCFISYSSTDQRLADLVSLELESHELNVFLSSTSVGPGDDWSQTVFQNLKESPWVIFLATNEGCHSPFVLMELGMAMNSNKTIIPIVFDANRSQLPGWIGNYQAMYCRRQTIEEIQAVSAQIATRIKKRLLIWPDELGAYSTKSSEEIPIFPETLPEFRFAGPDRDFWNNQFGSISSLRIFYDGNWEGIWQFPNTMNHCTAGLFMIRWRLANPDVFVESAVGYLKENITFGG